MFITLRTSSRGQNEALGMEQVARRNAGTGGVKDRARSARRPACIPCQTKKLRCTGSSRNCDRCLARLIECVSPTRNGRDKHRKPSSTPDSLSEPAKQSLDDASPELGDHLRGSISDDGEIEPNLGPSETPQQPREPVGVDALDGGLFDRGFTPIDLGAMTTTPVLGVHGLHLDGLGQDTAADNMEVPSHTCSINSRSSHADKPTVSSQGAHDGSGIPLNPARTNAPPCSCLSDLVRVVEQLDDDEFHITTLSLDLVLQLQKWLIFQCCKSLDCPNCLELSSTHTVRLIICDRLTEMFECIHGRIKRAGADLTSRSNGSSTAQSASSQPPDSQPPPSHPPLDTVPPHMPAAAVGSWPFPAQLFCGSSGRPANATACSPLMFSNDFRNQYSDEEQVHMMFPLVRLQIRNFQKLLVRLEETSPVVASQARQSKVKSMLARLFRASVDIEAAFGVVFQALSIG